jgi:hypothetical protein
MCEPSRYPKVRNPHVSVGREEDVAPFDVTVDLSVFVDVLQPDDGFVEDVGDVLLEVDVCHGFGGYFSVARGVILGLEDVLFSVEGVVEDSGCFEAVQGAPLVHELGDEPEVGVVDEASVTGEDVLVSAESHGLDFLPYVDEVCVDVLEVDDFDGAGDLLVGRIGEVRLVDGGEGSSAYFA